MRLGCFRGPELYEAKAGHSCVGEQLRSHVMYEMTVRPVADVLQTTGIYGEHR